MEEHLSNYSADYQSIPLWFPKPRQQIEKVSFEIAKFGAPRKNKHYILSGGHR